MGYLPAVCILLILNNITIHFDDHLMYYMI